MVSLEHSWDERLTEKVFFWESQYRTVHLNLGGTILGDFFCGNPSSRKFGEWSCNPLGNRMLAAHYPWFSEEGLFFGAGLR